LPRSLGDIAYQADWAETQAKKGTTKANQQREQKRMAEEMDMAGKELKTRRAHRLKQLYNELDNRYESCPQPAYMAHLLPTRRLHCGELSVAVCLPGTSKN